MSNKAKILELYYSEHLKQVEIAKMLDISEAYVCRVVNKDTRCKTEKDERKRITAENRKMFMTEYLKNYKRKSKDNTSKEELQAIHNKDVKALSTTSKLSNSVLIKWTPSAYHINKHGNLVLSLNQTVPSDMPKIIFRNTKIATQRYKKKCNFS